MRIETRVLAIERKLCLVAATTVVDFKSTRKARDVEKERHPSPDRAENSGQRFEFLNLADPGWKPRIYERRADNVRSDRSTDS